MEVGKFLFQGEQRKETFLVEEQHTAYHIGSGDELVLGTPWMISFMERVSNRLVARNMPAGYMSVGIQVEIRHLAPTPVGVDLSIFVEVLQVMKNRITLKVEAWDQFEKVGEGIHVRAVVEKARFMQRVKAKTESD